MTLKSLTGFQGSAEIDGRIREVVWDNVIGFLIKGVSLNEAESLLHKLSFVGPHAVPTEAQSALQRLFGAPDLADRIERALCELGEPQPGYPAPVAEAINILRFGTYRASSATLASPAHGSGGVGGSDPTVRVGSGASDEGGQQTTGGTQPETAEPTGRPSARRRGRAVTAAEASEAANAVEAETPAPATGGNGTKPAGDPWGLTPDGEAIDAATLKALQEQSSFKKVLVLLHEKGFKSREKLQEAVLALKDRVSAIEAADDRENRVNRFCVVNGID